MLKQQQVNKLTNSLEDIIKKNLLIELDKAVLIIKEEILKEYDSRLASVVTDRSSKSNPIFYVDEFTKRLDEFNYINKNSNGGITLNIPNTDNFDFSGRLRVLETIMRGISGAYVEVNEDEYKMIFGKKQINQEPVDDYVSPEDRIYLVRYDAKIRKVEKDLNKKFVRYPFSNSPPIDIFDSVEKFVDDNMNIWIDNAVKKAKRMFISRYKGVKL